MRRQLIGEQLRHIKLQRMHDPVERLIHLQQHKLRHFVQLGLPLVQRLMRPLPNNGRRDNNLLRHIVRSSNVQCALPARYKSVRSLFAGFVFKIDKQLK